MLARCRTLRSLHSAKCARSTPLRLRIVRSIPLLFITRIDARSIPFRATHRSAQLHSGHSIGPHTPSPRHLFALSPRPSAPCAPSECTPSQSRIRPSLAEYHGHTLTPDAPSLSCISCSAWLVHSSAPRPSDYIRDKRPAYVAIHFPPSLLRKSSLLPKCSISRTDTSSIPDSGPPCPPIEQSGIGPSHAE